MPCLSVLLTVLLFAPLLSRLLPAAITSLTSVGRKFQKAEAHKMSSDGAQDNFQQATVTRLLRPCTPPYEACVDETSEGGK